METVIDPKYKYKQFLQSDSQILSINHLRDGDRFADLVETIDGIVWEADASSFDFTYVNVYAQELLGYPIEDWYRPGFWVDIMHPDDKSWAPKYCMDCLNQRITNYEFEYRVYAQDGREVWLRDLVTLCFENGEPRWLRGIMVDITDAKKSEQTIASSQARFHSIFNNAPVGMLLINANTQQIVEINDFYCQLVGRQRQQVFADGWQAYLHPDEQAEDILNVLATASDELDADTNVRRFLQPDGTVVSAQLQLVTIDSQHDDDDDCHYLIMLEDITVRRKFENRIWRQANYDYLTGMPNRNLFEDRASQLISNYPRSGRKFALMMIDLDGFKDINDTLGHDMGDELLTQVAGRLSDCIRASDTLARFGGDEFVIILNNIHQREEVEQIAGKITDAIANVFELSGGEAFVTASIGITLYPDDADAVIDLLKNADQAMYDAKHGGRNRHRFFSSQLRETVISRVALINDMRSAIEQQSFELHYQPIIQLASGDVVKAEALIRWAHPQRGMVSPDEFIPLAEESRLIINIGDWVFREAARQLEQWQPSLGKDFQININTSALQFEVGAVEKFTAYLDNMQGIGIEITESLFMHSNDRVIDNLLKLRASGFQISLDDFGTGYSSLSYLKKFDIDFLKIDKSFVQNLTADSDDFVLCGAIIVMAHRLGMQVVAEGIETHEQCELLKSIDCDFGQGYFFSRPLASKEFSRRFIR